jgi:hypothetical protein
MAKSYLTLEFDNPHDVDEYSKARLKGCSAGIASAVTELQDGDSHQETVLALLGHSLPPAYPTATNLKLINLARKRTAAGLKQFVPEGRAVTRQYYRADDGQDPQPFDNALLDVTKRQASLLPSLKATAGHCIAVIHPLATPEGFKLPVEVFLWKDESRTAISGRRPGQSRGRPRRAPIAGDLLDVDGRPTPLEAVSGQLWDPLSSKLKVTSGEEGWEAQPMNEERAELELRSFMARSLMRLDKMAFGFGEGAIILRSVFREITARTRSLDLAGKAPINEAEIAHFLSQLRSAEDEPLGLPSVRLL